MRILAILFWLLIFALAAIGAAVVALALARHAHVPPGMVAALALTAALVITIAYLVLAATGGLAGTRRRFPRRLGPAQAIVMSAGFALISLAGIALVDIAAALTDILAGIPPAQLHAHVMAPPVLRAAIVAGYLCGLIFVLIYARTRAGERLRDGGPTGLAWRAPLPGGYRAAVLAAILVTAIALTLIHIVPPRPSSADKFDMAHLLGSSPAGLAVLFLIVIGIAPLIEEYAFRGFVLAAFATRCGPLWAALLSTAIFVALHAPEKLHYPPGFLDVGLMALAAAWLRLKYRSIRPGMLLHILYNGGVTVLAGLLAHAGK